MSAYGVFTTGISTSLPAGARTKTLTGKLTGASGIVGAALKLYVEKGSKWVKVAMTKTGKGGAYVVRVAGTPGPRRAPSGWCTPAGPGCSATALHSGIASQSGVGGRLVEQRP